MLTHSKNKTMSALAVVVVVAAICEDPGRENCGVLKCGPYIFG